MAVTINGSAGVTTNSGAVYNGLQTGTAVTASGTSVDFTGIPSWVKRITVLFTGVSLSSSAQILVQIGDSGGIENTGYFSGGATARDAAATLGFNSTSGFIVALGNATTNFFHGSVRIELLGSNTWIASVVGMVATSSSPSSNGLSGGGSKALSDTLDRIRITSTSTDTFDAGTINIIYE